MEKYVGDVILGKTQVVNGVQIKSFDTGSQVRMENHHPAIISRELFDAVQKEKRKRSRCRAIERGFNNYYSNTRRSQ